MNYNDRGVTDNAENDPPFQSLRKYPFKSINIQVAHGQAIEGGCTDGESAMTCVTECPYTAVGKKWNARHKLMFDGDDSVTVRLSPSPKSGMHKEEKVDFRFTMRFDKQKCSKAILNAINDGLLRNVFNVTFFLYSLIGRSARGSDWLRLANAIQLPFENSAQLGSS